MIDPGYGFILMHNHPSGDPSPSAADRLLTYRIRDAARMLSIDYIDHVIVGGTEAPLFSFRDEEGLR